MLKIDWNPPTRQLDQFGWISLVGFPALWGAWWLIARASGKADPSVVLLAVLCGIGAVIFALSRVDPRLVRWIFVGLMVVAIPIGMVISYALTAVIYFLLFTPVALVFRVLGRDPLHRRIDRQAESYWVERGQRRPASSYLRLY